MRFPALAGLVIIAALAFPASAQERGGASPAPADPPAQSEADAEKARAAEIARQVKEGFRLLRRYRSSIVSIRVTTRAYPLPPMNLTGVSQSSLGRVAEQLDGTGFVVSKDGLVATVHRLVGNPARIEVTLADGTATTAEVVGRAPNVGLAILKLAKPPLEARGVTESHDLTDSDEAGGWFFAATEDPREPDCTPLTVRLSADLGSAYDRFVTGRGALSPGAAGGPVIDREGRLLGMAAGGTFEVDAKTGAPTASTLFVQGRDVLRVVRDIQKKGEVQRPMLGVLLSERSNRIDLILPGGPADKAGLREGDRVLAVDGEPCATAMCIGRQLLRRRVGEKLTLRVERGEKELERTLVLAAAERPSASKIPPLAGVQLELAAVPDDKGPLRLKLIVQSVEPTSLAHRAGLQAGDVVLEIDGRSPIDHLQRHRFRPTTELPDRVRVRRGGTEHTIEFGSTDDTDER